MVQSTSVTLHQAVGKVIANNSLRNKIDGSISIVLEAIMLAAVAIFLLAAFLAARVVLMLVAFSIMLIGSVMNDRTTEAAALSRVVAS